MAAISKFGVKIKCKLVNMNNHEQAYKQRANHLLLSDKTHHTPLINLFCSHQFITLICNGKAGNMGTIRGSETPLKRLNNCFNSNIFQENWKAILPLPGNLFINVAEQTHNSLKTILCRVELGEWR